MSNYSKDRNLLLGWTETCFLVGQKPTSWFNAHHFSLNLHRINQINFNSYYQGVNSFQMWVASSKQPRSLYTHIYNLPLLRTNERAILITIQREIVIRLLGRQGYICIKERNKQEKHKIISRKHSQSWINQMFVHAQKVNRNKLLFSHHSPVTQANQVKIKRLFKAQIKSRNYVEGSVSWDWVAPLIGYSVMFPDGWVDKG